MHEEARAGGWFAAARQPRMLGLLLVLVLAAGACVRLGAWQLDRAVERSELAAARAAQARADEPAVALSEVVASQEGLTQLMIGRRVEVTGRYERSLPQFLVPEDSAAGEPGAVVLAPFVVEESGATLPVVRGWVPAPADRWSGELGPAGALALPPGAVTLVGRLAAGEAAGSAGGEDGVLASVSPGQLANLWGSPIYGGYVRLETSSPGEPAVLRPAPAALPAGGGLAWQNLAYAAQWWIFGGFALAVWLRLVRDEAARRRPDGAGSRPPVEDAEARLRE